MLAASERVLASQEEVGPVAHATRNRKLPMCAKHMDKHTDPYLVTISMWAEQAMALKKKMQKKTKTKKSLNVK